MTTPPGRRGQARERLLVAALELFAEHGVSGTSLQMIADRLGVSKAAVYHQFPAKEEIVLAVIRPVLDDLAALLARAEAATTIDEKRDEVFRGLVDLVMKHRHLAIVFQGDPGVKEALDADASLASMAARIGVIVAGPEPDVATMVAAEMLGGLVFAATSPVLAEVPEGVLRQELLTAARNLFS